MEAKIPPTSQTHVFLKWGEYLLNMGSKPFNECQ